VEHALGRADFFFQFAKGGAGGERAEDGVDGDVFDGGLGWRGGVLAGEVEAGDLEAVEHEAGAARVDVIGSDALEDLADGVLDGAAVLGVGEDEGLAVELAGF
jgi:hypothetical protein